MERSPALLILIAISLEIACFSFVKNPVILILISLIAIISACFLFRVRAKNTPFVSLMIILLTILCSIRIAAVLSAPPPETARAEFDGVVVSASAFGRGQALVVESDGGTYVIKRPMRESYKLGEILSLKGYIKPFQKPRDDSDFDEATFWKSNGVSAEIIVSSIEKNRADIFSLHSLRQLIHDKFNPLPKTLRGYLNSMWTGIRDKDLDTEHQRWGTSHLLSVSGFHVGLIAGIVQTLFYFLRFHLRIRGFIMSFIMWVYIFISGAAESAVRSAFMFQVGIFSGILGRRVHIVNSVAVAAIAMLLYSPFLFWSVGWRLSVIAAFTITALSELIINEKLKLWTWALISPIVFITTYPVVSSVFGSVPAAGIIINFFAVPFFAFAFPFISLIALLGVFHNITDAAMRLYGHVADFFAWIIPWNIPYNTFFSMFCVLFFYGLMYLALKNNIKE